MTSNRTRIGRLINKAVNEITDKEFYLSKVVLDYLNKKAKKVHEDWLIPDCATNIYYEPKDEGIAATNNKAYRVNSGNTVFKAKTREESFTRLCGVFYHEIGHRVFTNFTASKGYSTALKAGRLYPNIPVVNRMLEPSLKELQDFLSSDQRSMLEPLTAQLDNILEDGRIEYMLNTYCRQYQRLSTGLQCMREYMYDEMDDLEQIICHLANEEDYLDFNAILQLMLHYARFGEVKGYDDKYATVPVVKSFLKTVPYIDEALDSTLSGEYYNNLNLIIISLWKEISEYMKEMADKNDEQEGNSNENSSSQSSSDGANGNPQNGQSPNSNMTPEMAQQIAEQISQQLDNNLQGSTHDNSKDMDPPTSTGSDNNAIQEKLSNQNGSSQGESNDSSNSLQVNPQTGQDEPTDETSDSDVEVKAGADNTSSENKNPAPRMPKGKNIRISYEQTNDIQGGNGSDISKTSSQGLNGAKLDMDRLLKGIAEEKVDKKEEEDLLTMLNASKDNIDFGAAHSNVSACITRYEPTEYNKSEYNKIAPELKKVAKKMADKSKNLFSLDDSPFTVKNKYYGTKFNANSVASGTFKYFSKDIIFEDVPTVAVGLIVDESGSMSGDRCQASKAAALCLYEYCRFMNMPIAIYGHTTGMHRGYNVDINAYATFEKVDDNDKYRLMSLDAYGSNRDGYPLRMMVEEIKKVPCETKLLFIISDGQPNDNGYHGTAAEKDLQDIVKKCEKEDITLIAAAIGSDKGNIKRIYGEKRFLDISDLSKLPIALTRIIKRNL